MHLALLFSLIQTIIHFCFAVRDENRVAVCVSGKLRVSSLEWTSGGIYFSRYLAHFRGTSSGKLADNIIKNVFQPLAVNGFDLFVFVPTSSVQGEPLPNNKSACDVFNHPEIFNASNVSLAGNSPNRLFCNVEKETRLLNTFTASLPHWNKYCYKNNIPEHEGFLQQMYGIYRCNAAVRQYSASTGVRYKYKIRLREDMMWNKPIPIVNETELIIPRTPGLNCTSKLLITNRSVFPGGNEVGKQYCHCLYSFHNSTCYSHTFLSHL